MKACVLRAPAAIETNPLEYAEVAAPQPKSGEVLVRVRACGVCRTDLHVIEGELPPRKSPVIPGHQVVGIVERQGEDTRRFAIGDRVGIAWLHRTDGTCEYCKTGAENLCDNPMFTGFGAAAHVAIQVARHWNVEVFASTRDVRHQKLALELGAAWAGSTYDEPPKKLDAAIIFAPAGEIIPAALKALKKGGALILGGIHMSPIPSFSYDLLYQERAIRSVANNTRQDGEDFLRVAAEIPIRTRVQVFPLW